MKIYLAGPMTGYENFNMPAFMEKAKQLREHGHEVFNPIEADIEEYGDIVQAMKLATYHVCLKKDLDWICDHAEGIYMMDGWRESKGSLVEYALAKALKLEVMYGN